MKLVLRFLVWFENRRLKGLIRKLRPGNGNQAELQEMISTQARIINHYIKWLNQ